MCCTKELCSRSEWHGRSRKSMEKADRLMMVILWHLFDWRKFIFWRFFRKWAENDQQPAFGLCSPWSNESDHVFILFHLRSGRKLSLSVCAVSTDQRLGVKGTSIHLMSSLMSAGDVDVTLPLRVVSQIWDEARWKFQNWYDKKTYKNVHDMQNETMSHQHPRQPFHHRKKACCICCSSLRDSFRGIQRCQALSWNASLCAATSGQPISAGVPFPSTPSASFVWMVWSFKTLSDFHCRCRCRDILIVHETWRNTVKTSSAIHWLWLLFCNDGRQLGPEQGSLLSSKVTYVVLIDMDTFLGESVHNFYPLVI